ncbi:MAG TPA: protein-tyrosine phosphatase family protein [Gaiellaceae bacterium]|nr:protein-tyrosine phosphatase family protein [Gaiellaceae bacterium]
MEWPDFGLPAEPSRAAAQIAAAFERARAGELVEVGCRGGLGRTGTVLACMAVLAGLGPREAVEWVQEAYDPRAVETPEQERWVEWFAAEGRV